MTISEALEKAAAQARHGYEQRTAAQVSDDQIVRLLLRISGRGYIPTPATIPILRDYAPGGTAARADALYDKPGLSCYH